MTPQFLSPSLCDTNRESSLFFLSVYVLYTLYFNLPSSRIARSEASLPAARVEALPIRSECSATSFGFGPNVPLSPVTHGQPAHNSERLLYDHYSTMTAGRYRALSGHPTTTPPPQRRPRRQLCTPIMDSEPRPRTGSSMSPLVSFVTVKMDSYPICFVSSDCIPKLVNTLKECDISSCESASDVQYCTRSTGKHPIRPSDQETGKAQAKPHESHPAHPTI